MNNNFLSVILTINYKMVFLWKVEVGLKEKKREIGCKMKKMFITVFFHF